MAFGFWWLNGALMRATAQYGDVARNMASLWDSRLIQTSFALFWMLSALVVMIHATRRASRQEWLCGAALLGVVMVKLMLVDSAGGGGLSRAVAFIGVAILVLIVGYFSPLPPKQEMKNEMDESGSVYRAAGAFRPGVLRRGTNGIATGLRLWSFTRHVRSFPVVSSDAAACRL